MRLLSQPLRRSRGPTARGTSRPATFGSWPGGRSGHTYLTLVYQSPPQPACADEESCQEPAATPAADPQLVPRPGRHLGRRRRGIQRQGETDHQKSLRLQNAAGHRNGSVSRPRTTTRARMYPQILLRRRKLIPRGQQLPCRKLLLFSLLFRRCDERRGGGFLKCATHNAAVAVWEIRSLHHQDRGGVLYGIDPGLCAPGAAVAEGAR